jgi:4-hydroxythreonine-4-phosphate dehydrogenase
MTSLPDRRLPIAVTMGEPAGIGGEIALLAWARRTNATPPFFVIDDPDRLEALAARIGLDAPIEAIGQARDAPVAFRRALPVLPVGVAVAVEPGLPDPALARVTVTAIDRAMALVVGGEAGAMVTNPIHKTTLYEAGFGHPGHTEYLAERAGLTSPPVMMLACEALKVIPVTIHLALKDAVAGLTREAIVHCGRIAAGSLAQDFGIDRPRIAVAGLNPHAGEDGHLGREEIEIIAPAVSQLRSDGVAATGPFPADALFHAGARARYDAVLCMYHDQALIPLKTIDFDGGVNATLGLPFVRTSPDHGTAFDIAGSGQANPASFAAALHMADRMAANRQAWGAKAGVT